MVDAPAGMLGIEWIDGKSVRFLLGGGAEGEEVQEEGSDENDLQEQDPLQEYGVSQSRCMSYIQLWTYLNDSSMPGTLMELIGTEIAKMHQSDIIHGDLTTSNMMLRHPSSPKGLQLVRASHVLLLAVPVLELMWRDEGSHRLRARIHINSS